MVRTKTERLITHHNEKCVMTKLYLLFLSEVEEYIFIDLQPVSLRNAAPHLELVKHLFCFPGVDTQTYLITLHNDPHGGSISQAGLTLTHWLESDTQLVRS